jgi:hypothetical protein
MHTEQGALHLEVLSAIPGRLRIRLEKPIVSDTAFRNVLGVKKISYNPRIQTMLCLYDPAVITEERLIIRLGAVYSAQADTKLLHVKRCEEEGFSMAPSGYMALGCIALDGAMTMVNSPLTSVTRWLSVGSTLAAVVEHGYQELHVRGAFDPEVMSVVYLFNSIGKPNSIQACLVAWALTFGRHLLPHNPREQMYMVRRKGANIKLTPIHDGENGVRYAGEMISRGMQMMAPKP